MSVTKLAYKLLLASAGLMVVVSPPVATAKDAKEKTVDPSAGAKTVVLWRSPDDIASRNLLYGPGGKSHEPQGAFVFVKEDLDGTNPKFVVRDKDGVKWKVKMGNEARPETVASRVAWAVGYYTDEDYFVPSLHVQSMPAHLHRGQNMVASDGSVNDVRLKREEEKLRIGRGVRVPSPGRES